MTLNIPRESVEFIPVTVTADGAAYTGVVKVCVVPYGDRPATWVDPVTIGDQIGVMTQAGEPGVFAVWAQITDNPERPVIYCGSYRRT